MPRGARLQVNFQLRCAGNCREILALGHRPSTSGFRLDARDMNAYVTFPSLMDIR